MIPIAQPLIGEAEEQAVLEVLGSGRLAAGPKVAAFEAAFAGWIGLPSADRAVACANGTVALEVALRALGVGEGDEVVVPAFTFVATANAVLACGARPVLADVDPRTFTLDPDAAEAAVTDRTRALVPVHLFGHPADVDRLQAVADDHGLAVVGDAAQAHGAAVGDRRVGTLLEAETFSFYPTKNMTTGEGGLTTFADPQAADRARSLIDHGRPHGDAGDDATGDDARGYDHVRWGHNWRMTEVAGALGTVQADRLEELNAARRRHAARLTDRLAGLDDVTCPIERDGVTHVYHQYTLRSPRRDDLKAHLADQGVQSRVYYPHPLHRLPHLTGFADGDLKEAEQASREVLSLPCHPGLDDGDVERVADAVEAWATG